MKNKKQKCDYCDENKKDISDMLSNGYHICKDCAFYHLGKPISELETMAQKNEKERSFNRMRSV